MITVTTSVIDAERGEPNDTRDTTIEDNHHLNKTRKPKHNMNQATMMDAPSYEQKENTTYKEWTNKHASMTTRKTGQLFSFLSANQR